MYLRISSAVMLVSLCVSIGMFLRTMEAVSGAIQLQGIPCQADVFAFSIKFIHWFIRSTPFICFHTEDYTSRLISSEIAQLCIDEWNWNLG